MVGINANALVMIVGAIAFFLFAVRLRNFKISAEPPKSLAHLSLEKRRQRMRLASWLCVFSGCLMMIGALFALSLAKLSFPNPETAALILRR